MSARRDPLSSAFASMKAQRDVAVINAEESAEVSSEIFALCCSILDGAPDAAQARAKIEKHVAHVRSCLKGSCKTDALGATVRRQRDACVEALSKIARIPPYAAYYELSRAVKLAKAALALVEKEKP